jgi:CheY-like chemotaxis protein
VLSQAINLELRKLSRSSVAEQSSTKLSEDFARHYPLRILIAEDNPVNQVLATRALKKLGLDPVLADNGIIALEEVQRSHYDIILMDVQMPEMDGLEATRLIRKGIQQQPIIIAMTANAMAEDKQACLEAGMDDYMSKPVQLEELVKSLEKWAVFLQNKRKQVS